MVSETMCTNLKVVKRRLLIQISIITTISPIKSRFTFFASIPPTNPAQNHHNQHADGKSRYAFRHDRGDQACNLREKDDIQGILWGCFGIHGKEIKQHYQIDRSAADSKESGHGSEGGSDQDAENRIGNPERADPFFINCVEQGAGRDQQQD